MKFDAEILSKKVGPLPVGAWVAVIGGGIFVGRMWQSRTGGAGKLPGTGLPTTGGAVDGSIAPGEPSADTNDAWARRAIAALIAEGVEPTAAQAAIVNFLQGYSLTTAQSHIVDRALLLLGVPPEGVPPVYIDNGDPTQPPPPSDPADDPANDPLPWSYAAHPEYLNPTLAWEGGPSVGFLDFYNDQPADVQAYFYSLGQQPSATPYNAPAPSNSTPEFDAFYAQQSPDVQAYLFALGQA